LGLSEDVGGGPVVVRLKNDQALDGSVGSAGGAGASEDGWSVWSEADQFERRRWAEVIGGIVAHVQPPFTLGIYGTWGTGKTSLMRGVKAYLDAHPEFKTSTVWFESWQHQYDVNPVVGLLETAKHDIWGDKIPAELAAPTSKIGSVMKALLWTAADIAASFPIPVISGAANAAVKVKDSFQARKDEMMAERAQLEKDQVMLRETFRGALDELAQWEDTSPDPEKRLVIFIDDLDRCTAKTVVTLLEAIRLYMNHPRCVFVIGADKAAVKEAVKAETSLVGTENGDGKAEQYLEKIVQYGIQLPPYEAQARTEYVKRLLGEVVTDAKNMDGVVDILSAAVSDEEDLSLRRIIRIVNAFAVSHALGSGGVIQGYHPEIMALMTALVVLHEAEYRQLCKDTGEAEAMLRPLVTDATPGESGDDSGAGNPGHEAFRDDLWRAAPKLVEAAKGLRLAANWLESVKSYIEFAGTAAATAKEEPERPRPPEAPKFEWLEEDPTELVKHGDGSVADASQRIRAGEKVVRVGPYLWRVIKKEDSSALLLAEHVLRYDRWHESYEEGVHVTWHDSALRKLLNSADEGGFLERMGVVADAMARQRVVTDAIEDSGPSGGDPVEGQKVWLPSLEEAMQWRDSGVLGENRCVAYNTYGVRAWWWLRSPGRFAGSACYVHDDYLRALGWSLRRVSEVGGVRPAFILNLESSTA
jgi:hypothetical protein